VKCGYLGLFIFFFLNFMKSHLPSESGGFAHVRPLALVSVLLLCAVSVLSAGGPPLPSRYYVKHDATGANDGSSWADAFTDLQSALSPGVDSVFVAAGTYYPTSGTDQGVSFSLPSDKKLFGGFAGTEQWLVQRNIAANPTILSGNIGDSGTNADNSYNILTVPDNVTGVRVDGFTIERSNNGHTAGALSTAGGTSLDVANCLFQYNTAYIGGGIGNNGTMNVDRCTFSNNFGGSGGGGIFNNHLMTVTNCVFRANSGGDSGGAYFSPYQGNGTLINCLIADNFVYNYNGSAIFTGGSAYLALKNCTVVNNYNRRALAITNEQGNIENCIIWGNPWGPFSGACPVSYSLVEYGWGGTGNISADPLFVGNGDYHLQQCSPATNAGNDAAVPSGVTTDLDGNPRFFSHFSSSTVDMGAYELQNHSIIPAVYEVSGTASDCRGGINAPVMLSNSQLGVNYQWKIGGVDEGSSVPGTGAPLAFGAPTANGIYTASATSISGCTANMTGLAKVFLGDLTATLSPTNPLTGDVLSLNTGGRPLMSIEWQLNGSTVRREPSLFEPSGTIAAAGNGYGSASNQLTYPMDVAFDAAGNMYVSDLENHRVQKFAPGSTSGVTVAGGNGHGDALDQLAYPAGIWVAADGTVYVADSDNHRIQKWLPGASAGVTVAGGNGDGDAANQLDVPLGIFVDAQGDLYITDRDNHRIQKWASGAASGTTVAGGNGYGPSADQLAEPTDVLVDALGNLYITDADNHRIQKWSPGATSGTTVAGGNGSGSALKQLRYPNNIIFDINGDLLVSEPNNNRVSKWKIGAEEGIVVADGYGGGDFDYLGGIALDAAGALYLCDFYGYRVLKFAPRVQDFITLEDCGNWQAVVTDMVGCAATSNAVLVLTRWYADTDNDGYGDPAVYQDVCATPSGYVLDNTDCDDTRPNVNPGMAEICNDGLDNNCDGNALELTAPTVTTSPYAGCEGETIQISTDMDEAIQWYDAPNGGNLVATGRKMNITLTTSTTLYAQKNPLQFGQLGTVNTATALATVDHNNLTGDDGRGIAITPEYLFYTGDNNTVRYDHDLQNGVQLPRLDGLFSDLASGQVYVFRNGSSFSQYNIDRIQPVDIMGQPSGNPIMLNEPLEDMGYNSIVFNGFGYVIFYDEDGEDFYRISLPGGQVSLLKEDYEIEDYEDAESYWAWYMSEFDGTDYSVVYRERNTNKLLRLDLTTEQITTVVEFEKPLGFSGNDAAQFVYSPWDNRLFYHNEYENGYSSDSDETLTSFSATNLLQCTEAPRTPVVINVTPCAAPGSPNIRAGSVTFKSAILDWTPVVACNGSVPTDVFLSKNNTPPVAETMPTFNDVASGTQSFVFLECGTTYYAWLRTDCGSNESSWVGPFDFTTQSVDQALSISPSSPVARCAGVSTTFTATVPDGANLTWYDAPTGGSTVATGADLTVAPTTSTSYYAELSVSDNLPGSQNFSFTGTPQTFVVPEGVTSLQVTAKGASGGKPDWYDDSYLGKGGLVTTTLAVTPGQTLHLYVGGAGKFLNAVGTAAGFNGGGEDDDGGGGGGGGGATDIRIGGTDLTNRVVVAGGGGGATYNNTAGGHGGGLDGAAGGGLNPNEGGGGGSQTAGGVAGIGDVSSGDGFDGFPGTLGVGGDGGGNPDPNSGSYVTGAGGGGYYGGGGGGTYGGAGGGGSSYTDPVLCTHVTHTQGDNIGDGTLELSWVAYRTCVSSPRTEVRVNTTASPTGITLTNISACNGQGTNCVEDDFYTANIVVTYPSKPAAGTLSLTGADIISTPLPSANVSAIGATSHTFMGVMFRADGQAVGLTATFSDGACAFTNNTAGTAPASCSAGGNDTQPPTIACPANIVRNMGTGICTAAVTYPNPVLSDNCNLSLSSVPVPPSLPSGADFPKGISQVVWKVTDGAGLTATCSFSVTVNDNQVPNITCPSNIVQNNAAGECQAAVTYAPPTVSDNCTGVTGALQSGLPSGSNFPKGITTLTWKATDAAGLTKTCSFRITVNDTEAPAITCPTVAAVNTASNSCISAPVTYSTPTATDNCAPAPTVVRLSGPASGSTFPQGATTVIWRAIDGAGRSNTCSFKVTVNDVTTPTLTCPNNIAATAPPGSCNAVVTYTTPTATDNCGINTLFLLSGQPSGSSYAQGVTTNTWRATDNGGTSATCSFTVTVSCGTSPSGMMNDELGMMNQHDTRHSSFIIHNLSLNLAPNPATTEVRVLIDHLGKRSGLLSVFDAQGRLMWQQAIEGEKDLPQTAQYAHNLQVDTYPSGLYFVTLYSEGTVVTKRLVVER